MLGAKEHGSRCRRARERVRSSFSFSSPLFKPPPSPRRSCNHCRVEPDLVERVAEDDAHGSVLVRSLRAQVHRLRRRRRDGDSPFSSPEAVLRQLQGSRPPLMVGLRHSRARLSLALGANANHLEHQGPSSTPPERPRALARSASVSVHAGPSSSSALTSSRCAGLEPHLAGRVRRAVNRRLPTFSRPPAPPQPLEQVGELLLSLLPGAGAAISPRLGQSPGRPSAPSQRQLLLRRQVASVSVGRADDVGASPASWPPPRRARTRRTTHELHRNSSMGIRSVPVARVEVRAAAAAAAKTSSTRNAWKYRSRTAFACMNPLSIAERTLNVANGVNNRGGGGGGGGGRVGHHRVCLARVACEALRPGS